MSSSGPSIRKLVPKGCSIEEAGVRSKAHQPRRNSAVVACQHCVARRTRCGGLRPHCQPCMDASLDCVYDTPEGLNRHQALKQRINKLQATVDLLLQNKSSPSPASSQSTHDDQSPEKMDTIGATPEASGETQAVSGNGCANMQSSAELVELLRNESGSSALEILRSLRQGQSPTAILDSVKSKQSRSLSPSTIAADTATPALTPPESEFAIQYPMVNTMVHPQEIVSKRPYSVETVIPIDPRLYQVNIACWTSIVISDRFAVEAISLYLNTNQPWTLFNADLFINDLVSVKTGFCSRMLVNAVLAWATKSYTLFEPMADGLSPKFLGEALRIYHAEHGVDSLANMAAISLMSMMWNALGNNEVGRSLQEDSAMMAQRLGLYGDLNVSSSSLP